jgi:hypothetical protein
VDIGIAELKRRDLNNIPGDRVLDANGEKTARTSRAPGSPDKRKPHLLGTGPLAWQRHSRRRPQ